MSPYLRDLDLDACDSDLNQIDSYS